MHNTTPSKPPPMLSRTPKPRQCRTYIPQVYKLAKSNKVPLLTPKNIESTRINPSDHQIEATSTNLYIKDMMPTSKRRNLSRPPHIFVYKVKYTLSMMTKLDPSLLLQSRRLTKFQFAGFGTLTQSILTCMSQKSSII